MEKRIGKKGFTLLEAIASVFLVSVVLTGAITIIINVRSNAEATQKRLVATQVANLIRDDILADTTYVEATTWLNESAKTITFDSCPTDGSPFACTVFDYTSAEETYDDKTTIMFEAQSADAIIYRVVRFHIIIAYFGNRTIDVVGLVYE
jgi:type II secretory pathway pseudopilin PulG